MSRENEFLKITYASDEKNKPECNEIWDAYENCPNFSSPFLITNKYGTRKYLVINMVPKYGNYQKENTYLLKVIELSDMPTEERTITIKYEGEDYRFYDQEITMKNNPRKF